MIFPSVTKIIAPWSGSDFSHVKPSVLQAASERGTAVHNACFAYAAGLPSFGLDNAVLGYVNSFKAWFDFVVGTVISIEERLIDNDFGYHGEPDMVVVAKNGETVLVDIKTPAVKSKGWRLQLAAYARLVESSGVVKLDKIGSLRLMCDGGLPKMDLYTNSRDADFSVFLSCLNAYRFFNS